MTKSRLSLRVDLMLSVVLLLFGLPLTRPSGVRAQQIATVTVVGLDYAYQAPATLPAGLTAFAFENQGKVRHEVAIARLRPGATLDSVIHGAPGAARLRYLDFVGILIGEPGSRPLGRLLVQLAPGETYVLFCNFQDAPDKPRHLTMGMITGVQVK